MNEKEEVKYITLDGREYCIHCENKGCEKCRTKQYSIPRLSERRMAKNDR